MNNYLAIDTSSRYLTVLAKNGEEVYLNHIPDCAMQHSVVLMGEIEKAFSALNFTPADCGYFSAVTGPGSFTGIRIGIATAKGFALAANKPLKPVTSFDLIAYNVNSKNFYVAIDAAHAHYYVCGYADGKVSFAPRYMSEEEVNALNSPVFGFEDLPLNNYAKLNVKDCLRPAVEKITTLSDGLEALYVRKSQAEEALLASKRVEI